MFQLLLDPLLYLLCLLCAWRFYQNYAIKDEMSLRVPNTVVYPLPFLLQARHEPLADRPRRRCVSSGQLVRQTLTVMLPQVFIYNIHVQLTAVIVVEVITMNPNQQRVRPGQVKPRQVIAFLHGLHAGLDRYVWVLSSTAPPVPFLSPASGSPRRPAAPRCARSPPYIGHTACPPYLAIVLVPDKVIWRVNWLHYLNYEPISRT